ncbi:kinase-like protein, partial [Leucogyrophana mollusca]
MSVVLCPGYLAAGPGREFATGRKAAVKTIKVGQFKDGLPYARSSTSLLDVFSSKTNLNLVLQFLDSDLEMIIKDRTLVTFRGLEFCRRDFVLHRDLKPNNLLIASDGQLKITDFRTQVITRRYYSTAVDTWSVGWIFADLMLRTPYLPAKLISPCEQGHRKLPDHVPTLNLLSKCLIYEPRKHIGAKEDLRHAYVFALPYPSHPSKLPKPSNSTSSRPLEEVDGNVDMNASGPGGKASAPNRLKRKLSSPGDELGGRLLARKVD